MKTLKIRTRIFETGAAAGQVVNSAADLAQQAERLNSDVDQFLANVRAA